MSSRFGIDGAFLVGFGVAGGRIAPLLDAEHRCELLEQVRAVVGAGAGFGVVLDAERVPAAHPQALAHPVVQVDVGELGAAAERVGVDGEVVVLAGDLDLAGGQVADRVVAAVVPERELPGLGAEGATEELVPQAAPEHRDVAEQTGPGLLRSGHGLWVAVPACEAPPPPLPGPPRRLQPDSAL